MRSLARKTAASTSEIQGIISRLQQGSRQATEAMHDSRASVARCVSSEDTTALLDAIANEIEAISQMNEMIAAATHEQTAVSADMGVTCRSVQQVAERNAGDASALDGGGRQLHELAGRLGSLVVASPCNGPPAPRGVPGRVADGHRARLLEAAQTAATSNRACAGTRSPLSSSTITPSACSWRSAGQCCA